MDYFRNLYSQGFIPYDFNTLKSMTKDKGIFYEYERRENDLKKHIQEFEKNKIIYEENIKTAEEEVNSINKTIKLNEEMLKKYKTQQINYYTELLKNGIDVRSEGLVWIIRNLIELNVDILPELFPTYLDIESIDILTKIATKQIEVKQLETLKKCLINNQRRLTIEIPNISHYQDLNMKGRKSKNEDEIYKEDKFVTDIINNLKLKMKNYFSYDEDLIIREISEDINPLINSMGPSEQQKSIYDQLYQIKVEIKECNIIISKFKKDLLMHFKKYEDYKHGNLNALILYDLISSSFFGSNKIL